MAWSPWKTGSNQFTTKYFGIIATYVSLWSLERYVLAPMGPQYIPLSLIRVHHHRLRYDVQLNVSYSNEGFNYQICEPKIQTLADIRQFDGKKAPPPQKIPSSVIDFSNASWIKALWWYTESHDVPDIVSEKGSDDSALRAFYFLPWWVGSTHQDTSSFLEPPE